MSEKIRTVCIDTLTGIQNEMWMTATKKPGHDQWMDMGKDIWQLISDLQDRGFEIVLVLGEPGKNLVSLYNEIQNLLYSRQRKMFS